MYLDVGVLERVEVGEVGPWLLHQVSHLLREHAARYPRRPASWGPDAGPLGSRTAEQRRWNVAGDAEINDDLYTAKLELPEVAIHPSRLALPEGWTSEQYRDALDAGEITTDPDRLAAPGARQDDGEATGPCSAMSDTARSGEHDCGTGCDGQDRCWNRNKPGLSVVGARLVARDTARRIREHTRQRGVTPAGWQRWADEMLEPSVNWRRQLAAHVRRGAAHRTGRLHLPPALSPRCRGPRRRASEPPTAATAGRARDRHVGDLGAIRLEGAAAPTWALGLMPPLPSGRART
jgi:Putative metallopeptidase domain